MKYFYCLSLFLLIQLNVLAQNKLDDSYLLSSSFNIFEDANFIEFQEDSILIRVPSVNELIHNARNSAQVKYYETQKEVDERDLRTIRRSWMTYIKLTASYQYGVADSYQMYSQADVIIPPNDKYTHQAQSYYLLGAGIYLPISEIFNISNRVKQQKIKTKEKDFQAQMWHDDQALKIVECYTEAMENMALLYPLMEEYSVAKAQYNVSEVDFVKGKINIQELNRQKSMLSNVRINYERNKMTLIKNLLKLEILSNTKIIKISNK